MSSTIEKTFKLDLDTDNDVDSVTLHIHAPNAEGEVKVSALVDTTLDIYKGENEAAGERGFGQTETIISREEALRLRGLPSWQATKEDLQAFLPELSTSGATLDERKAALDREISASASVLSGVRDSGDLGSVLGGLAVTPDLTDGAGLLTDNRSAPNKAESLDGLGTKASLSGQSSYGAGAVANKSSAVEVGTLDRTSIDAVIKRHRSQITYCYQRVLQHNPGLKGDIVVKFVIMKDGSVSKAEIKSSHWSDPNAGKKVEAAVTARIQRFRFPEPKGGGIVIVNYPFSFSGKEGFGGRVEDE